MIGWMRLRRTRTYVVVFGAAEAVSLVLIHWVDGAGGGQAHRTFWLLAAQLPGVMAGAVLGERLGERRPARVRRRASDAGAGAVGGGGAGG